MEQNDLTQEILARLDILAAKLGTTVEYLWPALVSKEMAMGVSSIIIGVLCIIVAFVGTKIFCKMCQEVDAAEPKDEGMWAGFAFVAGCVVLVAVIAGAAHLMDSDTYARICAPEAYALQSLIE